MVFKENTEGELIYIGNDLKFAWYPDSICLAKKRWTFVSLKKENNLKYFTYFNQDFHMISSYIPSISTCEKFDACLRRFEDSNLLSSRNTEFASTPALKTP